MKSATADLHAQIAMLTRELQGERAAREASERSVLSALTDQQRRLARQMHDTALQTLNAARILARLARDAAQNTRPDQSSVLSELEELIKTAADEVQALTRG